MTTSNVRLSPLGWYVELPVPADEILRRRKPRRSNPVDLAGRAQANLYLLRPASLERLLVRLVKSGTPYDDLAQCLRIEDLMRRGRAGEALEPLAPLARKHGAVGAWAGLRMAEALERTGRVEDAERTLADSRHRVPEEPPLLRAMVEALLSFREGRPGFALRHLEAAASRIEEAPESLRAAFHRARAVYLTLLGDVPQALLHHRHALEGYRRLGDRYMLAKEYLSFGQTYLEDGELDHASFFFRKAAEAAEEVEHPPLDALLASRTGMLELARGDLKESARQFERDLEVCTRMGFRHGRAFALRNLGKVRARLGDPEEALPLLAESVIAFEDQSDPVNRELTRLEEAAARLARGNRSDAAAARGILDRSRAFFQDVDRPELLAQVQAVNARLLAEEGKLELARQEMDRAVQALARHRRPDRVVEALMAFGRILIRVGAESEAVSHLGLAYRTAAEAGRPSLASAVIERLAQVSERAVMDLVGDRGAERDRAAPESSPWYEQTIDGSRARAMTDLLEQVRAVAPTEETVLIEGETGTGKEVLARSLHALSDRAGDVFVALNCGAVPETLLESELFGHERGAFTGATEQRVGLLESAGGGTVFLDEIGELSPRGQVMLLRFLEDRQVRPVGSIRPRRVDVRVVAATNRNLREEVRRGAFRKDLYFRLAVYPVRIPALRERREDLASLVALFLKHNPNAQAKGIETLSPAAGKALARHDWPGNLRELDNVIRAATIRCRGKRILKEDLPPGLMDEPLKPAAFATLEEMTTRHIEEALRRTDGHQGRAARLLGIHRNTLAAKRRNVSSASTRE